MYAYKDLLELAGLTTRLYTLISTLLNLPPLPAVSSDADDTIELSHVDVGIPLTIAKDPISMSAEDVELAGSSSGATGTSPDSSPPLVKDLSFLLKEGDHLMITGANGVGKTAVARVLAGIWAPQGASAVVRRPASSPSSSSSFPSTSPRPPVFVVPQRAYMVTGSLLDQVIYPHSYPQFVKSGKTEKDLMDILEMVFLAYLPEREGGWGTRKEWRDILSGGEKQRMGLARAFYHRPRFAILDGEWGGWGVVKDRVLIAADRVHERGVERCGGEDVRAREELGDHAHHHLASVSEPPLSPPTSACPH